MSHAALSLTLLVAGALGAGAAAMTPARRHAGTARPLSEHAFGVVAFAFLLVSWAGVLLAEIGWFGLGSLAILVALAAAVLVVLALWRGARERPSLRATPLLAVCVAVLLMGVWLDGRPFDPRLEARDPGVYELAGWSLARHGSWTYEDPLVAGLEPAVREALFPPPPLQAAYDSLRYLGFYLEDRDSGLVVPQFLPLHSVWAAIVHLVAGPAGVGYAAVGAALLAALAALFAGYRLGGVEVGAIAALWLTANVSEMWFARYSAAELFAQLLLLICGWALIEHRRTGGAVFGVMAACSVGLTWFTKAELFVLVVPLAALLLIERASGTALRRLPSFWLPLALVAAHAALSARFVSWPYVHYLTLVVEIPAWTVGALAAGGLVALALVWRWLGGWTEERRRSFRALLSPRTRLGARLRGLAAVLVVAVVAYNYWIRAGHRGWRADVLVDLGTVVTPLGLLVAVCGLVLLLRGRSLPAGATAWLGLLLFGSAVVVWNRSIFPQFMWVARRYLPIMLPLTILAGAFALGRARALLTAALERRLPRAAALTVAAAVVLVPLGAVAWRTLETTLEYRDVPELAGTGEILARLDAMLEDDALVLVEPRSTRGLLRFEAALDYALHRQVLRIQDPQVEGPWLRDLVWDQARRGRPVYLLTTGYLGLVQEPLLEPVANLDVGIYKLEEIQGRLPETVETLRFRARLYRVATHGRIAPLDGELDVGAWDDAYVDRLSLWETEADATGRNYRWTTEHARLFLPGLTPQARELAVWADPDTPPSVPGQRMEVVLDGRSLGTFELREGWRAYRVSLPADWSPPEDGIPVLELLVNGFRPRDHDTESTDRRLLGVKVDRIVWDGEDGR